MWRLDETNAAAHGFDWAHANALLVPGAPDRLFTGGIEWSGQAIGPFRDGAGTQCCIGQPATLDHIDFHLIDWTESIITPQTTFYEARTRVNVFINVPEPCATFLLVVGVCLFHV